MKIEQIFGQVLKEVRKEKGLSQEELGFETGYHRTYISLLERGLKSPSLNTIHKLSISLEIPPSQFMRRVEKKIGKT